LQREERGSRENSFLSHHFEILKKFKA